MKEVRKQKTLAEWEEEKKNKPAKIPENIQMRNEYKDLMKNFDEKNIRFFYFRKVFYSGENDNTQFCRTQGVTAATLLNKDFNTIKIAFSFCDTKDNFCKLEGKIEALKRLVTPDKFYIDKAWCGDSMVDAAVAFNKMEKPVKFKHWKFGFQVELITKR